MLIVRIILVLSNPVLPLSPLLSPSFFSLSFSYPLSVTLSLTIFQLILSYSLLQISIGTIETSSTDYRIASKVVNTPYDQKRYQDLTPVHLEESNEIIKFKNKKEIDPGYLARKQLGPTERDLSVLRVPNPLVEIKFKIDTNNTNSNNTVDSSTVKIGQQINQGGLKGSTSTTGYRPVGTGSGSGSGIGGLESTVDSITLMPKFSFDIK